MAARKKDLAEAESPLFDYDLPPLLDPEEAEREARASFVRRRIEERASLRAPPLDELPEPDGLDGLELEQIPGLDRLPQSMPPRPNSSPSVPRAPVRSLAPTLPRPSDPVTKRPPAPSVQRSPAPVIEPTAGKERAKRATPNPAVKARPGVGNISEESTYDRKKDWRSEE